LESKQLHSIIGIWTNACRFLLAAVFIFSGFVKAVDPLGTQYKIQDYLEVFGWAASVPAFLPFLASVLQAMVEFCLGVYLLFGIRRRMTTLFVVLIMGVMTPLTLWLALSNPISDCGCFGDAVTLTNWETFGKNVLLLIAAVSVFKWGNRITPLVTKRFDWLVAMYTFLYISGMTLYCYRELPVFDFRPYHIGADIRKGMEIPEGEKPTVYETRFILQKDGVEKEFTLENYPDSTWTFVDSKTMVKEQGYEPPIHDFSIIRQEDGEDITDEVLDDDNYTFLLVAHLHDPNFTAERYFLAHPDPTISKLAADMINDRYQLSKSNSQAMVKDEERLHELVPHQLIDFKLAILEEDMKYTLQALNKPEVVANADKCLEVMAHFKELSELQKIMAKRAGDRVVLK
jgi:uncharacterized membrane protein YphA (DoxX/SURF4 family)